MSFVGREGAEDEQKNPPPTAWWLFASFCLVFFFTLGLYSFSSPCTKSGMNVCGISFLVVRCSCSACWQIELTSSLSGSKQLFAQLIHRLASTCVHPDRLCVLSLHHFSFFPLLNEEKAQPNSRYFNVSTNIMATVLAGFGC